MIIRIILLAGDFHLFANNARCGLDERDPTASVDPAEYVGYLKSIEECYHACKYISSVFAYGLNASDYWYSKCNSSGCPCFCETSSRFGSCIVTAHNDEQRGYSLYTDFGKAIIITRHREKLNWRN